MMRKNRWTVFVLAAAAALLLLCGCTMEASTFEVVSSFDESLDSGIHNYSYVVYTNSRSETEMVEYGQSLVGEEPGLVVVHFYDDRDLAPDVSAVDPTFAYGLDAYRDGRVMVYQRTADGEEFKWDGEMLQSESLS